MACYICLADEEDATAELFSGLCACTDRAVHAACLVRWIEQSGKTCCGVCKEELRGVSVVKKVTAKARAVHIAWLLFFLSGCAVPMYFTSVLIQGAIRDDNVGDIVASGILLCYVCGFSVGIFITWCESSPSIVTKVNINLPAPMRSAHVELPALA